MVPGASCVHEPTTRFNRWQDIGAIWNDSTTGHVGVSDSCLGLHLGELLEQYSPRTLIVRRPLNDVAASLRRIGLPITHRALTVLWGRLEPYLDHPLVKVVEFRDMNRRAYESLAFLMPGADIDPARVERMNGMNIQADVTATVATTRGRDLAPILGADVVAELQ